MAGGGTNTSTQYSIPSNPTIENYINQTIPKLQATQDVAPLSQFAQPQQRQIAGMSPLQQYAAGMVPQIAQGNAQSQNALGSLGYGNTGTDSALGQLSQLTSGPIGSSPATQAGMAAFQGNVLPTLQNELGAMGLGRSGIAAEQIQKATTSAAVPLLQQEIANRAASVPQYTNIAQAGSGIGQQEVQNLGTAAGLGASLGSTQQQLAQSVYDQPYQDYLRRQALSQSVTGLGGTPYQPGLSQTSSTPSPGFWGK
jgi:hypothetical protein